MRVQDAILISQKSPEELPPSDLPNYVRGMERLLAALQRLSSARDAEAILEIVRRTAREITGADGASPVLRDGGFSAHAKDDAGARRAQPYEAELLQALADAATSALENVQRHDELARSLADRVRELEIANRELEALSYSISHDLRAPLRAIAGFTQALIQDHAAKLDADGVACLQRVQGAGQRLGGLIDDLLELSRVTRSELRRTFVDVSALAEAITAELREREPARDVRVSITPGLHAEADARLLRRALVALLGNAWKFTSRTAAAEIIVGAERRPEGDRFFIRDNGVGFDQQYSGKLFTPFQRLHAVNEFPGTGMGLAIVQRVVHRHGGSISAESEPGKGAIFVFSLPEASTSR